MTAAVQAVPAAAQSGAPLCGQNTCAAVDGDGGGIKVGVQRGVSDAVPGRGTPATHGDAPGRRQWKTLEEQLVPACVGNSREDGNALCMGAVSSCPADDQIRWWIWHKTDEHVRDDAGNVTTTPGEWAQLPGSFCLGSDDPGVPTIGQVIAQVQAEFRNLPLPVAGVQVDPAPTSLVNIPTAFFAGGAQAATFNPTILGTSVTINATPTSWAWTWGDGTTQSTTSPGVPKRPVVAHEYRQASDYTASVATTWTGTFTVAGSDEVFPIRTPAVVRSAPVAVQVREARTQLVDE